LFLVPDSDLFIQIMPVVMRVDFATTSWLDAFVSTLSMTIVKDDFSIKNIQNIVCRCYIG
jgi:hypothetical protein